MISGRFLLGRNLLVNWRRDKVCPDCGSVSKMSETLPMRDVCGKMWRKYQGLDDQHCSLWSNAQVALVTESQEKVPQAIVWENMPNIVGRS